MLLNAGGEVFHTSLFDETKSLEVEKSKKNFCSE